MLEKDAAAVDPDVLAKWLTAENRAVPEKLGKLASTVTVSESKRVSYNLPQGAVVITAITSCTNTSNPSVLIAAGLLAKKAVERGLGNQAVGQDVPGSRVEGRHGLLERRRTDPLPRGTGLPPDGLRMHDLHR